MLKDVDWAEDGTYCPQGKKTPIDFYSAALENSLFFDLELGYFSSAAINVLSYSFAAFIKNGGKMRMAINNIVSKEDKEAIEKGEAGEIVAPLNLDDWYSIRENLDEYGEHFFRCLSYMIQEKRIEIKIIKPKDTSGISHTKRGLFDDGKMIVSFTGSANFTIGGLINNREEISLSFSSSPDPIVQKRIDNQKKAFSTLMAGKAEDVEYLSTDDLIEAIRNEFGNQDIEDLLDVEEKLKAYKRARANIASESSIGYETTPHFPYPQGPRDYQRLAFNNWKDNGQKGLFAMATGTGKTITSLNCLLEIYNRKGYYKAIILVPTITLVNQWEEECRKFNFTNIIKVFSKNPLWFDDIDRLIFNAKYKKENEPETSFIIISTYSSFSRQRVFEQLNGFERKQVLLIADECHNMGSPAILKKLDKIVYGRRIGLSATPERQFDESGNAKLFKFFGAEDHFTFEYSMKEAIDNGVLCKYEYYPHVVELTPEEMDEYLQISLKIAKYFNCNTGTFEKQDEILKRLLLKRKRIVHKAANKLKIFKEIVQKRFIEKGNLKYTLVYVPEGNKPDYLKGEDYFDTIEQIPDDADTDHLIDTYTGAILDIDEQVTVRKFVSGQKDRKELLDDFASGKVQVLTSMKCLDEGVDVPRSELAIFCASTGNPRQFIQRRGRVLRTHKDKRFAVLHDLIVVPQIGYSCDSYRMEQNLLRNELLRVNNFALLSMNPSFTEIELREVMDYYSLNLYNNNYLS